MKWKFGCQDDFIGEKIADKQLRVSLPVKRNPNQSKSTTTVKQGGYQINFKSVGTFVLIKPCQKMKI